MNLSFDKELFSARLRGKRAELKLSQADLAEKACICSDAIFKYENGVYAPGADKIFALAEALGCTPNDLMGWDDRQDERKAG